jgi:hypothetical protein
VKGTAATGSFVAAPNPSAPGQMHMSTRYIRPYVQINYAAGDGTAEIDYVSLEIVDQVANTSGEVTLSGDGTAGAPLSAALTGTRSGNWSVPAGDVFVGDGAQGAFRPVRILRNIGGKKYEVQLGLSILNGTGFMAGLLENDVGMASLVLDVTRQLWVNDSVTSVARPIPFATHSQVVNFVVTATDRQSIAITFPAGRFTQPPHVFSTLNQGTPQLITAVSSVVVGGCTTTVRHIDAAVTTTSAPVYVLAMQMLPGAAPGLREIEPEGSAFVVTCHTEDCENDGIPVTLYHVGDEVIPVICGVCGQPITDVTTP